MQKRRTLACLAAALILTLGLSACGTKAAPPAAPSPAPSPPAPVPVPAPQPQPDKLAIWTQKNFVAAVNDQFQKIADDFGKAKGVKVEVSYLSFSDLPNKLAAAVEGKSLPDISIVESPGAVALYQKAGVVEDVSDLVKAFGKPLPLVEESSKISDKFYSLVTSVVVIPLQYRKDYLQAANIKAPDTWDEVLTAATRLTDPAKGRYGLALALGKSNDAESMIRPILWSFGGREFSADGGKATINSPETVAALKYISQLVSQGVPPGAVGWDLTGDNKSYESGESAFNMNTGTIIAKAMGQGGDRNLGENTGAVLPPAGPGGRHTFAYIDTYVVFKGKGASLAKDFFKFMYQRDNYVAFLKSFGGFNLPGYDGFLAESDAYYKEDARRLTFRQMAQYAHAVGWPGPSNAAANEIFNRGLLTDMVQKVVARKVAPEQAAAEAQKAYQEIIDTHKK